jgi:hypothetical protein
MEVQVQKRRFPYGKVLASIVLGVALGIALGTMHPWKPTEGIAYDANAFYAVFLTNNQVYFGKLSESGSRYPVLSDVYYIQAATSQDLTKGSQSGSQLQLVKLGSELHQPQDTMYPTATRFCLLSH